MKSDRKRQISYDTTYMWTLKKNDTNELIYKSETDSQKTNLWLPKGRAGIKEDINSEFGINIYTLLPIK